MVDANHASVWDWRSSAVPIGLGGSVFGWIVPPSATDEILDRFFEIGGRFIDTSDAYSHASRPIGRDSESLIGSWAKRRGVADDLRIITKIGLCPGVDGLAPRVVERAVDASLERLGVQKIEAILAHADDHVTAPEDVAEGLAALVGERCRHIGVSRFSRERLVATGLALASAGKPSLSVVQEEFSLAERGDVEALCSARELPSAPGIICSAALARGFLTGKFENVHERVGSRQAFVEKRYSTPADHELLRRLRRIARDHGVEPAALALRWLIHHKSVVLPLASVTCTAQLAVFRDAARLELSETAWTVLDELSSALPRQR